MAEVGAFGAKGDGQADDTAALQHALTAGDGVLQFRKGSYRITRPLVIDLPRRGPGAVLGLGGTSRLIMAGPGPALRIVGAHRGTAVPASVQPHTWDRERFPIVGGIEIVGEHPDAVGIELVRTMQATITQVLIRRCKYAVHLVERNRNFLLSDSHLYDNAVYGVFIDRCNLHQANITGCHISYCKRAGIMSLGGDVHNFQITGNDIEYNNLPGDKVSPNGAEIWFDSGSGGTISEVTIASNTLQATVQPGGANVRIHGPDKESDGGAWLIAITGNVIGSQSRALDLKNVRRLTLTGNTIYDSADLSIAAAGCSGLAISGNSLVWRGRDGDKLSDGIRLEDCDNGVLTGMTAVRLCAGAPETGAAVTLVRCRDFAVHNCQILDPLVRGVELESCVRCRVSDNTVVDRRAAPSMRQAIRVHGKGRDNVIVNNLVGGARERSIEATPGSAVLGTNFEVNPA